MGTLGKTTLLVVVPVLLIVGVGVGLGLNWSRLGFDGAPPLERFEKLGGDFTLTSHFGAQTSLSQFRGKVVLLTFGYTLCPDVCPTTLAELTRVHRKLGRDSTRVQTLFITVDPERDSAARLKDYLSSFHPGMIGLTGPLPEISALALKYGSYFAKQESNAAAEYLMDHTAFTYLLDQEGIVRHLYHFGDGTDLIVKGVRQLLNTGR